MTTLATLIGIGPGVGYAGLFAVVCAEAGGVPVPGETALITAAIAAASGRLHIAAVIPVAAAAAIVGDNGGYLIGRQVGRRLLEAPGPFSRRRREVLEKGEPFFARHGTRAVFLGRWILGLRTWASWLAGANHMRWRSFALWNAAGGIAWATTVGLLAYSLGQAARTAVSALGIAGAATALIALTALLVHQHSATLAHHGEAYVAARRRVNHLEDNVTDTAAPTFENDIKPLFRESDRTAMLAAFDLWSFEDVKENAEGILGAVSSGSMPCDMQWPETQVDLLQRWIDGGTPR